MAKQATISLTADIANFKKSIEEAKSAMSTMGSVKIDTTATDHLVEKMKNELPKAAKDLESNIKGVLDQLNQMGAASSSAFDSERVSKLLKKLNEYKTNLKGIRDYERSLNPVGPQLPEGKAPPSGGGTPPPNPPPKQKPVESSAGKMLGGVSSMAGGMAGAVGLAIGIGQLYSRRVEQANENLQIRALTGGSTVSGMPGPDSQKAARGMGLSNLGFDSKNRRARALGVAGALGADLSPEALNRSVDRGEIIERGYGVSAEQQAGFLGTARKGGTGDTVPQNAQKLLEGSIQTGFEMGLRGSRIGEFLQGIQSATEQMSQGVTIDQGSMVGFAASLMKGSDFFKADPNRAFRSQGQMDDAFRGNDRFQQALSSRAIALAMEKNMPGSSEATSPFSVELRRSQGLFGNKMTGQEKEFIGGQQGGKDLLKVLGVGGPEILTAKAKDALELSKGKDIDFRVYDFKQRMGLEDTEAAIEIMRKMVDKQGNTIESAKLGEKEVNKVKMGQLRPEERMQKTMENMDGSVADLDTRISELSDILANRVTTAILKLDQSMSGLLSIIEKLTGSQIDGMGLAANVGTAAIGAGALASGYGIAKGISKAKGATGLLRGGTAAAATAAEGGAVAAEGAVAAKAAPSAMSTILKFAGSASALLSLTKDSGPLSGIGKLRQEKENFPHLKDYKFGLSGSASGIAPEERASKLAETPIDDIFGKGGADIVRKKFPGVKTGGDYEKVSSALEQALSDKEGTKEGELVAPIEDRPGKKRLSKEELMAQAKGESSGSDPLAGLRDIFGSMPDNRPDLSQNTQAIKELTAKLSAGGGGGGGGSRLPGNATMFNGRTGR